MFQKIRFLWLLFPLFVLSCSFIVDFTGLTNREICNNGIDDDNDSRMDCEDPDCQENSNCTGSEICNNGIDDDNDSRMDCEDPDCSMDPGCAMQWCNNTQSWYWNHQWIGLYFSEVFGNDTSCPPDFICSIHQNAENVFNPPICYQPLPGEQLKRVMEPCTDANREHCQEGLICTISEQNQQQLTTLRPSYKPSSLSRRAVVLSTVYDSRDAG